MTGSDTYTPVRFSKRWNLTNTVRGGWRVGDLTVSATYDEGHEPCRETMQTIAEEAMEEAQEVADKKNHEQNQTRRFTG